MLSYDAQENKIFENQRQWSQNAFKVMQNYINFFIGNLKTVKFIQFTINHKIIAI